MSDSQERPERGTAGTPQLTAGGHVAGGRYRLLESHGGSDGLGFWQARDERLSRDVALTFVDPREGEEAPGSAPDVLDRAQGLTQVYSAGLAAVMDVVRGRGGGIIVTEWTPGTSLAGAAADPDPDSAAHSLRLLAEAAERAGDAGVVLSIDSPDRIRITPDGAAVLAFPGTRPGAGGTDDIRGLGATLYTLLSGRWPLELPDGSDEKETAHSRPPAAERDDGGAPVDPSRGDPAVPGEPAAIAMRALDGTAISSAATVRSLLDELSGVRRDVPGMRPTFAPSAPAGDSEGESDWYDEPASSAPLLSDDTDDGSSGQQRKWTIMAVSAAVAVILIAGLSFWLLDAFSADDDQVPLSEQLDEIEREARESREAEAANEAGSDGDGAGEDPGTGGETGAANAGADAAEPLTVSGSTSWQPSDSPGVPDNSASASNLFDSDDDTTWSTSTYRNQFGDTPPSWKEGTGVLATLSGAATPQEAEISVDTPGVTVEIRGVGSADVTDLDDTTLLGTADISGSSDTVELEGDSEYQYVLVWVTGLDQQGPGAYIATLSEVEIRG